MNLFSAVAQGLPSLGGAAHTLRARRASSASPKLSPEARATRGVPAQATHRLNPVLESGDAGEDGGLLRGVAAQGGDEAGDAVDGPPPVGSLAVEGSPGVPLEAGTHPPKTSALRQASQSEGGQRPLSLFPRWAAASLCLAVRPVPRGGRTPDFLLCKPSGPIGTTSTEAAFQLLSRFSPAFRLTLQPDWASPPAQTMVCRMTPPHQSRSLQCALSTTGSSACCSTSGRGPFAAKGGRVGQSRRPPESPRPAGRGPPPCGSGGPPLVSAGKGTWDFPACHLGALPLFLARAGPPRRPPFAPKIRRLQENVGATAQGVLSHTHTLIVPVVHAEPGTPCWVKDGWNWSPKSGPSSSPLGPRGCQGKAPTVKPSPAGDETGVAVGQDLPCGGKASQLHPVVHLGAAGQLHQGNVVAGMEAGKSPKAGLGGRRRPGSIGGALHGPQSCRTGRRGSPAHTPHTPIRVLLWRGAGALLESAAQGSRTPPA